MDNSDEDGFRRGRRQRLDIRVGVERRRRWSHDEKLRLVRETLEAGAIIAEVARRNEVSSSLLYVWRRQALAGLIEGFHQVRIVPEARETRCIPASADRAIVSQSEAPRLALEAGKSENAAAGSEAKQSRGHIEVTLRDGTELRIDGEVRPDMLRILLGTLVRS